MVDYNRARATAKRLIEQNGRDVQLYRITREPADSATPWRGPTSTDAVLSATGTLAFNIGQNAVDSETVIIGSTVYTFKTVLTVNPVAFEVLIGVDADASLANLAAAINAAAGAGIVYGTGTTAHLFVTAAAGDPNQMVVTARYAGAVGNSIEVDDTLAEAAWTNPNLTGGYGLRITVKAAMIDYTEEDRDETLYRSGDKRALIAASAVEQALTTQGFAIPLPKFKEFDFLLDGDDRWKIEKIDLIAPGPVDVVYDCRLRS